MTPSIDDIDPAVMQEFFKDIYSPDPLGRVLRVSTDIQQQLSEFIQAHLYSPASFESLWLTYAQTVRLANALGMPDDLVRPLEDLGNLRNEFCHGKRDDIEREREDRTISSFPKYLIEATSMVLSSIRSTPKLAGVFIPEDMTEDLEDLPTPFRWIFLMTVLRTYLLHLPQIVALRAEEEGRSFSVVRSGPSD